MARRRRLIATRLAGLRRWPLRVAREAVVRDRLPLGGVGGELTIRGPDARVVIEEAHTDGCDLAGVRIDAPECRAAGGAEGLRETVGRLVGADELLAGDADRAGHDARLRGRRGSRALLAAGAVAVARRDRRLGELEANPSAEAATGQGLGHERESTAGVGLEDPPHPGGPPRAHKTGS